MKFNVKSGIISYNLLSYIHGHGAQFFNENCKNLFEIFNDEVEFDDMQLEDNHWTNILTIQIIYFLQKIVLRMIVISLFIFKF